MNCDADAASLLVNLNNNNSLNVSTNISNNINNKFNTPGKSYSVVMSTPVPNILKQKISMKKSNVF